MVEDAYRFALADLWPAGVHGPSPFDRAAASELDRRLEAALDDLPESYREVLLLVGVEGLTPSEAAGVCGVSPEAMRQRLSRARGQLAARLDELRSKRSTTLKVVLS
jgi:RNA polymerase sigma-70 factor (ECF subfamily)